VLQWLRMLYWNPQKSQKMHHKGAETDDVLFQQDNARPDKCCHNCCHCMFGVYSATICSLQPGSSS
jgi:hypothetical protein